jgi:hypothetical protein
MSSKCFADNSEYSPISLTNDLYEVELLYDIINKPALFSCQAGAIINSVVCSFRLRMNRGLHYIYLRGGCEDIVQTKSKKLIEN